MFNVKEILFGVEKWTGGRERGRERAEERDRESEKFNQITINNNLEWMILYTQKMDNILISREAANNLNLITAYSQWKVRSKFLLYDDKPEFRNA